MTCHIHYRGRLKVSGADFLRDYQTEFQDQFPKMQLLSNNSWAATHQCVCKVGHFCCAFATNTKFQVLFSIWRSFCKSLLLGFVGFFIFFFLMQVYKSAEKHVLCQCAPKLVLYHSNERCLLTILPVKILSITVPCRIWHVPKSLIGSQHHYFPVKPEHLHRGVWIWMHQNDQIFNLPF